MIIELVIISITVVSVLTIQFLRQGTKQDNAKNRIVYLFENHPKTVDISIQSMLLMVIILSNIILFTEYLGEIVAIEAVAIVCLLIIWPLVMWFCRYQLTMYSKSLGVSQKLEYNPVYVITLVLICWTGTLIVAGIATVGEIINPLIIITIQGFFFYAFTITGIRKILDSSDDPNNLPKKKFNQQLHAMIAVLIWVISLGALIISSLFAFAGLTMSSGPAGAFGIISIPIKKSLVKARGTGD